MAKSDVYPMDTGSQAVTADGSQALLVDQHELAKATWDETIFMLPQAPQTSYAELFYEPPNLAVQGLGSSVSSWIHKNYGAAFEYTANGTYYILALVVGSILSVVWGLLFGVTYFVVNWILNPVWKQILIYLRAAYVLYRAAFRCVLDPCMQSVALTLGGIRATFRIGVSGISSADQLPQILPSSPTATNDESGDP